MAFVIAPMLEEAEATHVAWNLDLPVREFRRLLAERRILVDRGCCGDAARCTTYCYAGRTARVDRTTHLNTAPFDPSASDAA
jgi:hypothetical protein